jgi:hypothetical protein
MLSKCRDLIIMSLPKIVNSGVNLNNGLFFYLAVERHSPSIVGTLPVGFYRDDPSTVPALVR